MIWPDVRMPLTTALTLATTAAAAPASAVIISANAKLCMHLSRKREHKTHILYHMSHRSRFRATPKRLASSFLVSYRNRATTMWCAPYAQNWCEVLRAGAYENILSKFSANAAALDAAATAVAAAATERNVYARSPACVRGHQLNRIMYLCKTV